jgi:hypothetical protein
MNWDYYYHNILHLTKVYTDKLLIVTAQLDENLNLFVL